MNIKKNEYVVSKKFKELTDNVDFMEKVIESKTEEEVRELFKKEGLTLSDTDVQYLTETISEVAKKIGIMPEEELSYVAGGLNNLAAGAIGAAGATVAVGAVGVAGAVYAFKRGVNYANAWWKAKILGIGEGEGDI